MSSVAAPPMLPPPLRYMRIRAPLMSLLAAALAGAGGMALAVGAMPLSLADVLSGADGGLQRAIFADIRAPRVMLAGLVGAALAVSGAALQGLFRNPLADPGLIGVSSGAALGAIAMIVLGSAWAPLLAYTPWATPLAAVAGAVAVTLFLYAFSRRYGQFHIATIVLAGIAVNALAAVGIGAFQYLSDDAGLRALTFWMMGSFGRATWFTITPAAMLMVAAAAPLFVVDRDLDRLQLGESEAFHLGVDTRRLKRRVILCSATAVGAGVALSGIVGFVGLVVPHLARLALGSSHRYLLPGAALLGATLTMLADMFSRTVAAPAEIPVSLVTSALGAPFFLWLIACRRRR